MPAEPPRLPLRAPQGGQVLAGRYRLDGPLGSGGTADVLRATDLRLRRPVAVKRFRPGAGTVGEDAFRQEAVLLAGLRHPGLVTVYDAGRDEHGAYLVMDLIDGVTLRERIAAGPVPYDQVVRLGCRLASALAHVHAAGIVHRDVKPSNVLLNADGEPFLADFGLSRPSDYPTRAEPGTVVGTAAYMAPEQVLGKGYVPASDIYALGLVLLECVKGEKEYLGAPQEAGAARLLRRPEMTAGVPEALVPVIEAMTHSDPLARPDAARCALLLQAVADADAPHPMAVSAAGTDVEPGSGTTTSTQVTAVPSRTESGTVGSAARRRRPRVLAAVAAAVAAVALGAIGAVLALAVHGNQSAPDAVHDDRSPTAASTAPAAPLVRHGHPPTATPARPSVLAPPTTAVTLADHPTNPPTDTATDPADQPGNGNAGTSGKGSGNSGNANNGNENGNSGGKGKGSGKDTPDGESGQ